MAKKYLFILFLMTAFQASAQFELNVPKWYPEMKPAALYVVGDAGNEYAQKIKQIITDNWTACPVHFLPAKEISESLLVPGNLFLTTDLYSIESQYARANKTYGQISYNDYYYLHIWTINKKYNPKWTLPENKTTVIRAELYMRTIGMGDEEYKAFELTDAPKSVYETERKSRRKTSFDIFDPYYGDDYLNAMPGMIKNKIQYANKAVQDLKDQKLLSDYTDEAALSKLKNDTLYIPNLWWGRHAIMPENIKQDSKMYKQTVSYITDLVNAYPFPKRLIARDELDQLILDTRKDLYYLNYVQSSADKIISVVNGKSGEVIYRESSKNSYRPKEKDLEKLGKSIQ